jgi:hypothetical protein
MNILAVDCTLNGIVASSLETNRAARKFILELAEEL